MDKTVDPRMHSAEHILNQTMDRIYGCGRCFNAHVEKKKTKCDYRFDHPLTKAEIGDIEERVNDVIKEDLSVTEVFMTLEEARKHYNLGKVPADVTDIRIVKIGEYDACPCIGPHVNHTKEVGLFKITTTSFENHVLRVRFKLL
jgi:Ser-tRNA(Ala) deacylase AlaX